MAGGVRSTRPDVPDSSARRREGFRLRDPSMWRAIAPSRGVDPTRGNDHPSLARAKLAEPALGAEHPSESEGCCRRQHKHSTAEAAQM